MKIHPKCSCRQGDQGIAKHYDCPIHGQEVREQFKMKTQKPNETEIWNSQQRRYIRQTSQQRQAAVARAKAKRDRFKNSAITSFSPSVIPCKKSGIKYNGNPLSQMA